jgi:hypothetical protein
MAYARAAREHGKEGRARVCARRAAGWAVATSFPEVPRKGAFSLLRWLESEGPEELRAAAGRLTERVTPDHELPHDGDPLQDAALIVDGLLGQI